MAHNRLAYILFKKYLRLTHETLLVRQRYIIGSENIPKDGERYFIASNHENTANDPLNIIFSLPDKTLVGSLARANMFELNNKATAFLRFIRIMPAYRLDWEGVGSLDKNLKVYDEITLRVNRGEPVIVFPSAGHSQGHYLLHFTTGIVRMALQTIDSNGWKHDVKILPTALFYADYNSPRSDVMWIVGKPISLMQYKDSYHEHPYKIMRHVRDELWQRIHSMMLDEGVENYDAVDFLRRLFSPGANEQLSLPDRLTADKKFVANVRGNAHYGMLVALARFIKRYERIIGVDDENIRNPLSISKLTLTGIILLALLPLWIVSLWPHAICYRLPLVMLKEDKMFTNSYRYILSALFLYPITAIITIIMSAIAGYWWAGLLWVILWIPTGIFCWNYWRRIRRLFDNVRMRRHSYTVARIRILHKRVSRLLSGDFSGK